MTDARYLVIGGTGVIGHFVTRRLIDEGHRPVVLTVSGNSRLIDDFLDGVDVEVGDIIEGGALNEIVAARTITHIPHLGAFLGGEDDPAREAGRATVCRSRRA